MKRMTLILSLIALICTTLSAYATEIKKPHPDAFCGGRNICEYKGEIWRCVDRNSEGDCTKMERVIISKASNPTASHAEKTTTSPSKPEKPSPLVFDKNRSWCPEKVPYNDAIWKCGKYNEDGTCAYVVKVKDLVPE